MRGVSSQWGAFRSGGADRPQGGIGAHGRGALVNEVIDVDIDHRLAREDGDERAQREEGAEGDGRLAALPAPLRAMTTAPTSDAR